MGERVLIDTDVLIEYVKGKIDLPEDGIYYISEITLYEFIRGTKDPSKAKKILEEEFIVVWNDNRVIETASTIYRKLKEDGKLLSDADIIIASTAIVNRLKLWTLNRKHFERLKEFGLEIVE
jgi:predicted nucleic acid-binding protein